MRRPPRSQSNLGINELTGTPFKIVSVLVELPYDRKEASTSGGTDGAASRRASTTSLSQTTTSTSNSAVAAGASGSFGMPDLGSIWMGQVMMVRHGVTVPPDLLEPVVPEPVEEGAAAAPRRMTLAARLMPMRDWIDRRSSMHRRRVVRDDSTVPVVAMESYEVEYRPTVVVDSSAAPAPLVARTSSGANLLGPDGAPADPSPTPSPI